IKLLGVRLGGEAAIGAAFMLLADHLAPSSPSQIIVNLPMAYAHLDPEPRIVEKDPDLKVEILDNERVLAEFLSDRADGWFVTKQLAPDATHWTLARFTVTRARTIHLDAEK